MFFEIIEMHKNNYLEQNDVHLVKNEKEKKMKNSDHFKEENECKL